MMDWWPITEVLGGLALFLFGLRRLSDGLENLAGGTLRTALHRATQNRVAGYLLGTGMGFFLHSSGATVMLVGFLNAGLMSLGQAVPVVLGANVGTTLSMQAISFNITAFSYPALALGLAAGFSKARALSASGWALFGFGLLFLGMDVMKGGVEPFQSDLKPWLEQLDASSWTGILIGIGISLAITAVVQSSGATLGMSFAMVEAEVFTSLDQLFPIVLGAHIGTCVTATLASLGSQPGARRVPVAHVLFNLFNVALALALRGPLLSLTDTLGGDLVRQTANLNTVIMLGASLMLLPVAGLYSRFVRWVSPSSWNESTRSSLTPERMRSPDTALTAAREEMARLTDLAVESLTAGRNLLAGPDPKRFRRIQHIEEVFDSIKDTMIPQLRTLESREETERDQVFALNRWIHAVVEMERVGDHIQSFGQIGRERHGESETVPFGDEFREELDGLFDETLEMLDRLRGMLEDDALDADDLLERRREIESHVDRASDRLRRDAADEDATPLLLYYGSSYLELFERLARHIHHVAGGSQITWMQASGYEDAPSDSPVTW